MKRDFLHVFCQNCVQNFVPIIFLTHIWIWSERHKGIHVDEKRGKAEPEKSWRQKHLGTNWHLWKMKTPTRCWKIAHSCMKMFDKLYLCEWIWEKSQQIHKILWKLTIIHKEIWKCSLKRVKIYSREEK